MALLPLLDLGNTEADSLEVLIQGKWPVLWHLDLTQNELRETACQCLARGVWPHFAIFRWCGIDSDCLREVSGCWSSLKKLDLDGISDIRVLDVYSIGQGFSMERTVACKASHICVSSQTMQLSCSTNWQTVTRLQLICPCPLVDGTNSMLEVMPSVTASLLFVFRFSYAK